MMFLELYRKCTQFIFLVEQNGCVLEPISGSLQTPFRETNLGSEHLEMLATQTLNMSKNRHHQKPATFSREDFILVGAPPKM